MRPSPSPSGHRRAGLTFTASQWQLLRQCWLELADVGGWHPALPVLLFDRCWLRLDRVDVQQLERHLPFDRSHAAPELVRFRSLIRSGLDPWGAQQACWLEFGEEACQQAQTRFWCQVDQVQHAWSLERYLGLIADYRRRLQLSGPPAVPLIVRARAGEARAPELVWLTDGPGRCATLANDCSLADGRRFHPGDLPDDSRRAG